MNHSHCLGRRWHQLALWSLAALASAASAQPLALEKPVRYDGDVVARVQIRNLADLLRLEEWSSDPWTCSGPGIGPVDYRMSRARLADLSAAGIAHQVLIPDVQALIDAENARLSAPAQANAAWFSDYKTYAQFSAYVDQLVAQFPGRARRITLGNSLGAAPGTPQPIFAIEVSAPNAPVDRPAIFLHGLQHAREWITGMTAMFIADALLNRYGSDARVTNALDNLTFIIVPVMNPDGYLYTWSNDRFWRKNRRPNSGSTSIGVDLNRNWSFGWGINTPGFSAGSSGNPASGTYRGPSAFSEPETRALRDYVTANPRIRAYLDIHSYSQLILSPFGYTNVPATDNALFLDLNAAIKSGIAAVNGLQYTAGPTFTTIYPAAGVSQDWAYGVGGILAFGIELRDTGQNGFVLPPAQIIPNAEEMLGGLLALADRLDSAVQVTFPVAIPALVQAGASSTITFSIASGFELAGAAVPQIVYRVGRVGSFVPVVATPTSTAGTFTFAFPAAPCGSDVSFFIRARSAKNTLVEFPLAGLSGPLTIGTGTRPQPGAPLVACIPCPTDFNLDGANNQEDLSAFITAWVAAEFASDYNGDGEFNQEDLAPYITDYFESACPG